MAAFALAKPTTPWHQPEFFFPIRPLTYCAEVDRAVLWGFIKRPATWRCNDGEPDDPGHL